MKSRSGFVSNSSSSSFIYVGAYIDPNKGRGKKPTPPKQTCETSEQIIEYKKKLTEYEKQLKLWENADNIIELLENAGLSSMHNSEYSEDTIIGSCLKRSYDEGEDCELDIDTIINSKKLVKAIFNKFGINEDINLHFITRYN